MPTVEVEAAGERASVTFDEARVSRIPRSEADVRRDFMQQGGDVAAGIAAARAFYGIPASVRIVPWTFGDMTVDAVCDSKLAAGDVLALPPRLDASGAPKPYLIDSAGGFKASGVTEVEYLSDADFAAQGYTAKVVSGWAPVIGNRNRLWFSMCRLRAGVIGLHSSVSIGLTDSGWKGARQPKVSRGMRYANGTTGSTIGSQEKIVEMETGGYLCNVSFRGRDLGTIAYSGIAARPGTVTRDLYIDPYFWNGFAGIPNGEAGGLVLGATYDIADVYLDTQLARSSSPLMLNKAKGGKASRVYVGPHRIGMVTHWGSTGTHVWEDFETNGGTVGLNIESCGPDFVLDYRSGALNCLAGAADKHVNIGGPDVGVGRGAATIRIGAGVTSIRRSNLGPGKLIAHAYSGKIDQTSRVTWDGGPVAHVPASQWLA